MSYRPKFTDEQIDWICYQIGEWYLDMKPLLEGAHNLGFMKEKLKMMICDEDMEHFKNRDTGTIGSFANDEETSK